MKKFIIVLFALFLLVGNVSALSDEQIETINGVIASINKKDHIILTARDDINALLRLDPHVNNDNVILAQIELAKQRAATAASDLNDLLNP